MDATEQKDLDELKEAIKAKKISCYEYMVSLDRADARQLKTSGYTGKTNAEAMQDAFRRSKKEVDKLIAAYVKKYPDER